MIAKKVNPKSKIQYSKSPCTWASEEFCQSCDLSSHLMCRFDPKDLTGFLLGFLPFGLAVVIGMILGGYGWYLLGWLAYWFFFFLVWEARVLCRHCPYWAEESRVLHCHANYGVVKIWKFDPRPMSKAEGVHFIIGALLLIGYPILFLILGGQTLLIILALIAAAVFGVNLRQKACSRCVNFSCPANTVPKPIVDAYLRRNPVMRRAWEASGYQLTE